MPKNTPNRKGAKAPTIEARARAIIADAEGYAKETRRSVEHALAELTTSVERAEAGDMVCDLTDPRVIERAERPDLAEMIAAVWNHPACPPEIWEGLNVGTSDLFNNLNNREHGVYMTAPYIRALILEHEAQKGRAKQ